MSAVTVELPNDLQEKLERIAELEGVSMSDLLIEAAEKMSQLEILEQIKRDASQRGTREGFDRFLHAVPDVEPEDPQDKITT